MNFKNYLFNLYQDFPNGFSVSKYKDPDKVSKELYDDLKRIFFEDSYLKKLGLTSIENKSQKSKFENDKDNFYTLFVDGKKHLLSADYIGPSVLWAKKAELNEKEIIDFLSISRTIGGHIVFPRGRGQDTVNTARGGKKGYYDRFDLTLRAIKLWYSKNHNIKINQAIENYKDWFELFINDRGNKGFENFVEFFSLDGFISTDYKIIDLVKSDIENKKIIYLNDSEEENDITIPDKKGEYLQYIKNKNIIILERTKKLEIKSGRV